MSKPRITPAVNQKITIERDKGAGAIYSFKWAGLNELEAKRYRINYLANHSLISISIFAFLHIGKQSTFGKGIPKRGKIIVDFTECL